jgi:hypothetical protein
MPSAAGRAAARHHVRMRPTSRARRSSRSPPLRMSPARRCPVSYKASPAGPGGWGSFLVFLVPSYTVVLVQPAPVPGTWTTQTVTLPSGAERGDERGERESRSSGWRARPTRARCSSTRSTSGDRHERAQIES